MVPLARRFAIAAGVSLLGSMVPGQGIWIVDKLNRPGTHFTDIPPAVAAAASGDIILVRYADRAYQNIYQAPTIARGMLILGEQIGRGMPGALTVPRLQGILTVSGIAADKRVVIANLGLDDLTNSLTGVNCTGNAGELHFVNCEFSTGRLMSVLFTDCARVRLRSCWIDARAGGTVATRSDLVVENSTLRSGYYRDPFSSTILPGRPGLELVSSSALLVRSQSYGCGGYQNDPWCQIIYGDPPVPAAIVDANSRLFAGAGSRLTGAASFLMSLCFQSYAELAVVNQGVLVLDPGCRVAGPITGPFVTQTQWQTWSSLAPIGGTLTAGITAPPGTPVILASSFQPQAPIATPIGLLGLDPASMLVLRFGVADANSTFSHSLPVSTWIPIGELLAFQAAVMLPNGSVVLATPSTTPILPPLH